jgi:hypothetical protein
MKTDYLLTSNDDLTLVVKAKALLTWNALTEYIKLLPYGRNKNRADVSLLLKEQKGTCSSKHAFLKVIADLNAIPDVKLILGMYKMNSSNTPKIGNVLIKNGISYIPEAHCYLKINGEPIDLTSPSSNFNSIKNFILFEKEITTYQVAEFKVNYHKDYIKKWITDHNIPSSFNDLWHMREQCIANLSV